jgi:hypothetical protein
MAYDFAAPLYNSSNTNTWITGYIGGGKGGGRSGNPIVYSLFYSFEVFTSANMYVAGDFDFTFNNGSDRCQYICLLNIETREWKTIGNNISSVSNDTDIQYNQPDGPVYSITYNDDNLFIGGTFTINTGSVNISSLAMLSDSGWSQVSSTIPIQIQPPKSMYSCRTYDMACPRGSLGMVGVNGFSAFYNGKTDTWLNFGGGVNGSLNSVATQFWWPKSSAMLSSSSFSVMLFCFIAILCLS